MQTINNYRRIMIKTTYPVAVISAAILLCLLFGPVFTS